MAKIDNKDDLTYTFLYNWRNLGGPVLEREVLLIPGRQFRADFAFVRAKVAIELDGGTWAQIGGKRCPYCGQVPAGAHGRGKGITRDDTKSNLAQLAGWKLFRFTADMLRDDPAGHLEPVIRLIAEGEQ